MQKLKYSYSIPEAATPNALAINKPHAIRNAHNLKSEMFSGMNSKTSVRIAHEPINMHMIIDPMTVPVSMEVAPSKTEKVIVTINILRLLFWHYNTFGYTRNILTSFELMEGKTCWRKI